MNGATLCSLLAAALMLCCCGTPPPPTLSRQVATESLARWNAHSLSSYEFEIENRCYCTIHGNFRVTVRDNRIVDVFDLKYGIHLPEEVYQRYALFRTISGLFDQLDTIRLSNPQKLEVSFDPTYGYPTEVAVDGDRGVTDDELVYYVRNLETRTIW